MALNKKISTVPKKRAAKRMPAKSEADKKAALDKIWKDIEKRENEQKQRKEEKNKLMQKKERTTFTIDGQEFTTITRVDIKNLVASKRREDKAFLKGNRDRVKQIESQRQHLLEQPGVENPYRGAMLVKYKTAAEKESTLNARGRNSEGTVMSEKRYKELLKRNKITLDKSKKKDESSKLYLISTEQHRSLTRENLLDDFSDYHKKLTDYIMLKHEKGKIDFDTALDLMKKVNFSVKSAVTQRKIINQKYPDYKEMHTRVLEKILTNFLKKRDYPEMQRTLNTISVSLKENRGVFKTLNELDGFYKK